jgi:hypothetical protein
MIADMHPHRTGRIPVIIFALCLPMPGQIASCVWDDSAFSRNGVGFEVLAIQTFDDGSGPELVVGGRRSWPRSSLPVGSVEGFDGLRWRDMSRDLPGVVRAFAVFDDGNEQRLDAGGAFLVPAPAGIARWTGTSWEAVGAGLQVFPCRVTPPAGSS